MVLILVSILSIFSGCSNNVPKKYQVKNKETGIAINYYLNIVKSNEIGIDAVTEWLKQAKKSDGFLYYIYSDPDSWDVLIYLPNKQDVIASLNNNNIKISRADSVLKVYIDAPNVEAEDDTDKFPTLIHLKAPARGAWPSEIKVYWNDDQLNCDGFYFNT